jgi:hypothetical protein
MGKSLKRAALAIGAAAATLILLEAGLRVVGALTGVDYRVYLTELTNSDRLPQGLFEVEAGVGYRLHPKAQVLAVTADYSVIYQISSEGLRDREVRYSKPAGYTRVLALGDSFTFGEGVPMGERFTDVAQRRLSKVELLNSGVPGWGLDQELIYLVVHGLKLKPDVVAVFLNRVDTQRYSTDVVQGDRVVMPRAVSEERARQENAFYGHIVPTPGTTYVPRNDSFFHQSPWLVRSSVLLSYASFVWKVRRLEQRMKAHDEDHWQKVVAYDQKLWGEDAAGPTDETRSTATRIEQRTRALLAELARLSRQERFKLYVFNIDPTEHLGYVASIDPALKYFDLSGRLGERARSTPLTFRYDRHFNPTTHAFLGEAVADILARELGRVPR